MYKGGRFLKNQANILVRSDFLLRSKHFNEGFKFTFGPASSQNHFHQSQVSGTKLPLPLNIKDLASSEKLKFSPQRNRDINGSFISCSTSSNFNNDQSKSNNSSDDNIECYDCSGAINLSSTMQTNVPFPFTSKGKPIHLNMPGGQWGQKEKYVSEDLNNVHHINSKEIDQRSGTSFPLGSKRGTTNFYFCIPNKQLNIFNNSIFNFNNQSGSQFRTLSTEKAKPEIENIPKEKKLTTKEKLRLAIKDYGSVILVFHIGISLISLGSFYILVASGIDLSYIFKHFGIDEGATAAGTAATFVVAYAVHKSLAPVRITITLTAAPFVVKKLRNIGVLKAPKQKVD